MEQLDVYLSDCAVGTLTRSDDGSLTFSYMPG